MSENEKTFYTSKGEIITVEEFVSRYKDEERSFFVGTDSKNKKKTIFSTVIASYKQGDGGNYIYSRFTERKIDSLRQRLFKEAWYSLEFAFKLTELIRDSEVLTVHLDVNPNVRYKSSKYALQLSGLVESQGFPCQIKPDSWTATCLADGVVNKRFRRSKQK